MSDLYFRLSVLGIMTGVSLLLGVLSFMDIRPALRLAGRLRGSLRAPGRRIEPVPQGATEAYGDELRAMHDIQISDELTTEPMRMVITHADLDDIMARFRSGIDALCDEIAHQLDPHYERVMIDTGQVDMRELRAMLDAEDDNPA